LSDFRYGTGEKHLMLKSRVLFRCVVAIAVTLGVLAGMPGIGSSITSSAWAQEQGYVPGNSAGNVSDAELWRAIRKGVTGNVSIPDKKAGVLVQSDGDDFRMFRNGPLSSYGGWALLGIFLLLGAFFTLRGRIRIDSGLSGRTVLRFNDLERFTHWLTASSFIVLGLSGLNTLYGKFVLMPILGKSAFASLTLYSKMAHNYIGFAFMIGIALMLVIWVRDNIPSKLDVSWILQGGGMFSKGSHPPAKKFNAGQKLIFWATVLGGLSISYTGICLLFPFEFAPFAPTFALLNAFGFDLPTVISPLHETQLALLWHAVMALALIVIIIAHIYIGTLGMEGAIDAVTTGEVDENWAREHHSLWLEEVNQKSREPAE
jgi:formate dehydrogenase subunit gamma